MTKLGYIVINDNGTPAINNDYIDYVLPYSSGAESKILIFIGNVFASNNYQPVETTYSDIKKGTGVKSKITIRGALKSLMSQGFLIKVADSVYRPNPDIDIEQYIKNKKSRDEKPHKLNFVARAKSKKTKIKPSVRIKVFERDDFKCVYCGRSAQDGIRLEVDHIHPKSKGGSNKIDNLQTLCDECNQGKSDSIIKR